MQVVAYCAASYEIATRKAAGRQAKVYTCPPLTDHNLDGLRVELERADLILFNLHGVPDGAAWFATRQGPPVAIRARQLETLDLSGAVVFLENCYAGDDGNPMHKALQATGCKAIVSGPGENYGGSVEMAGADWLFWAVRMAMQMGDFLGRNIDIPALVDYATRLFARSSQFHNQDTAEFHAWTPKEGIKAYV